MKTFIRLAIFILLSSTALYALEHGEAQRPSTLRIIDLTQGDAPREGLYRDLYVLEDLGDRLVALPGEGDETIVAQYGLTSFLVPVPPESGDLYVVSLMDLDRSVLSRNATVLCAFETTALAAAFPDGADALARAVPHPGLKSGLRGMRLERIAPTRPFKAPATRVADPTIQAMVNQVDQANLLDMVQYLQDLGNRRPNLGGGLKAEAYLKERYEGLSGISVEIQKRPEQPDYSGNVIAELPGIEDPSIIYIVGGHYDSTNFNAIKAPGADDNASGTAGVYEIARILSQYRFKYTIRFIAFTMEEWGLIGSGFYCDRLVSQNENVQAMINLDMTAYRAEGDTYDVDFITNYSSSSLISFMRDMYEDYVPSLGIKQGSLSGGTSDHQSFTQHGYPACFPFEDIDQYSHYIHSVSDVIGLSANDFQLAQWITQGALAGVATLASPLTLAIQHSAVQNTTNEAGPYKVEATILSTIGSNIIRATLYYDLGGGYVFREMAPTDAPNGYISSIPGLGGPGTVNYYIETEDDQGNTQRLPSSLTQDHFSFYVGTVNDVFSDDFEIDDNGWTHAGSGQDDWMRNVCTGNGGYDPGAAFKGARVWGNDLGISGYNGNYQANVNNWLESPGIDCTGQTGVLLRFHRWLTVEKGTADQARILVNGTEVFSNPNDADLIDTAWTFQEIDISSVADNNPDVRVRFTLTTNSTVQYGGWNIDDLHLCTLGVGSTPALTRSEVYHPVSSGGTIDFDLDAGPANAGRNYLLLGSFSGTEPGIPLPGGGATLPLNWDALTDFVLAHLNTGVLVDFTGALDPAGQAAAQLVTGPLSPQQAGKTANFAFFLEGLPDWDFVSNPVDVLLVP